MNLIERIGRLEKRGYISFGRADAGKFMDYDGNFLDTLNTVASALDNPQLNVSALHLFLDTPRLLSGLTDFALREKRNVIIDKVLLEKAAVYIFQGRYAKARPLVNALYVSGSLLAAPVREKPDFISWCSYAPSILEDLAAKMSHRKVDCIVMDGHDGYRTGLAVAAALDVPAWGIKNSALPDGSHNPHPVAEEEKYHQHFLNGKHVWIVAEDISTGGAVMALREMLELIGTYKSIHCASGVWLPYSEHLPLRHPDCYAIRRSTH